MKVLRKVCGHCGYVMLFSVEVLCRPGTAVEFGRNCPCCGSEHNAVSTFTELDMEEITDDPDVEVIAASVRRALGV